MSEDSHLEAGRPTRITKTVRFGVPNSVDLEIWVRLDPQNNRLTRLRVQKARTKHRKEVEAESRQIRFDNRGSLNSTATLYALLQMQLKKADEFAEEQYSIFRDVWLRLGDVESAAFIRTISWMVIQRQFGPQGNSIAAEEARRSCATGGLHPGLPQEAIRRAFDTLKTGWRDKLEIKALEWEAEAQGKTLTPTVRTSPPGLPDPQPRQPGSESAAGRTEISSAAKPSKSPAATFYPKNGYQTIVFCDQEYRLTSQAGAIVKVLHEAGGKEVPKTEIQSKTRCGKISDSFRRIDGPQVWKKLIVVTKGRKGFYSLHPQAFTHSQ
jgi:hypothetical protein